MGKRSWKLFYARLRDLTLYLYKDAETAATATRLEEMALSYMKQVYRMQLHCQQLRFYHEQQVRFQQAFQNSTSVAHSTPAPAPTPSGESVPSQKEQEQTTCAGVARKEPEDGVDPEVEMGQEAIEEQMDVETLAGMEVVMENG